MPGLFQRTPAAADRERGNLVFGGQADGDRAGSGSNHGLSPVWDNGSTGGQISEMSCQ